MCRISVKGESHLVEERQDVGKKSAVSNDKTH
jgi:hypothetical protein